MPLLRAPAWGRGSSRLSVYSCQFSEEEENPRTSLSRRGWGTRPFYVGGKYYSGILTSIVCTHAKPTNCAQATRQPGRNLKYAALFISFTVFFAVSRPFAAGQQSGAQSVPEDKFLNTMVPEFELRNQNLVDGLWKLAKDPAPFAFGFEKILKTKLADADIPDPKFNLQLKNKTVREVLDALCEADPRFTWSMDGATVNVFLEPSVATLPISSIESSSGLS